jgi:hypothetical protein
MISAIRLKKRIHTGCMSAVYEDLLSEPHQGRQFSPGAQNRRRLATLGLLPWAVWIGMGKRVDLRKTILQEKPACSNTPPEITLTEFDDCERRDKQAPEKGLLAL